MDKLYSCQACGCRTKRYMGRCPKCNQFNTMVEQQPSRDAGVQVQMDYRTNFDWKYELAVVLLKTINPFAAFHTVDGMYVFIESQGYGWDGELWRTDDILP